MRCQNKVMPKPCSERLAKGVVERACAGADGAHEIGDDGERADTHAAEGRRGGNVPVQLFLQRLRRVAVALQYRTSHISADDQSLNQPHMLVPRLGFRWQLVGGTL